MLTFSWTGKRKKKSDVGDLSGTLSKSKSGSDHTDSSEPSVSRSTTSTGSIHFSQAATYSSSLGASFKEAEYSGRLLLHGSRLIEFPAEVFANMDLLDVVFIDISDNQLTDLPAEFATLDCLISCIARSNRFRSIPTCIYSIEQLSYLDLSFNELSHLPEGLFDLPLVTLRLAGNKISIIPETIRHLAPTLAHLDLSRNEIRHLPPHLRHLKSLRVLKLAHNSIEELPSDICSSNIPLRTLDLSNNNISFLPADFVKMRDLQQILLARNPLRSPPIDVIERGIIHIFKWLEGRTSGGSVASQVRFESSGVSQEKSLESRKSGNGAEPIKSYAYDHTAITNGTTTNRPKEIVERKVLPTAHPVKATTVCQVTNVPKLESNNYHQADIATAKQLNVINANGKENSKNIITPTDEQNNNSRPVISSLASPLIAKKPISKVAPMIKGTTRPTSSSTNTVAQSKISAVRRTAPTSMIASKTTVANNVGTAKRDIPTKTEMATNRTRIATATSRKSEEPSNLRSTRTVAASSTAIHKTSTASTTAINKVGARPVMMNDVDSARKLLREKLGSSFAISRGDSGFSQQLADGVELCRFVNKLQPETLNIASPSDVAPVTARNKLNVDRFVQYCKKLGVPDQTMCSSMDILTKRNPQKVARTVLSVAKLQPLQVSPTNSIQC